MKFESLLAVIRTAIRSRARSRCVLGAAALLLAFVAGCGTTPGAPEVTFEGNSQKASAANNVGEVELNLQVDSAIVQTVHYEVIGGSFDKTGTIDVSSAPRVSALVGGIPLGTGYTANLTADSTSGPAIHCTGSATFDVATIGTTPVGVHMACQESLNVPVPLGASVALCALLLGAGVVLGRSMRS